MFPQFWTLGVLGQGAAESVSGEGFFLACGWLPCSCPHLSHGERKIDLLHLFLQQKSCGTKASPLRSQVTLITTLEFPSPDKVTWGGASTYELGEKHTFSL